MNTQLDIINRPRVLDRNTKTEPSVKSLPVTREQLAVPFGVKGQTIATSNIEPNPDSQYAEISLRRPNRTAPIQSGYPDWTSEELTRATEDSGALDFWDDPEEGEWS